MKNILYKGEIIMNFYSKVIHGGISEDASTGAVNIPIEDIMKAQQWFFYMCQTINFNPVLIKKPTV